MPSLTVFALAVDEHTLHVPPWTVIPFILLLLAIAILPLIAPHWSHSNFNRFLVVAGLSLPVVGYLAYLQFVTGDHAALPALFHELKSYVCFIALLGSLYTVSGGIVITGNLEGRPLTNTAFLAGGAFLANFIGTTGASMLLIRPVLRINRERKVTKHIPVFFIFTVSNLGGLLTPLGDPPLFLGFLKNVPFFWTMSLWPQWLMANGMVLAIFFIWDTIAYRREKPAAYALDVREHHNLGLKGSINLLILAGVIAAVLLQGIWSDLDQPWRDLFLGLDAQWAGAVIMTAMAALSIFFTPKLYRQTNGFSWGPILEVAILFVGIFITMVPALAVLSDNGARFGISEPWQYFWMTGSLSAFLDNAPTYVTFATLAAGSGDFAALAADETWGKSILQAISCGAVFMGSMTYIGNGPNFMVKAIADEAGFRTPLFLGYAAYSCVILLPVFVVITLVFFR